MRVLIADDDAPTRTILARSLERPGIELLPASDGDRAWAIIREQQPAVAILDWMMPGLDGTAICRRIRQDPRHATMHVLMLSARNKPEDVILGLEAGADDYLIKPFHAGELKARINVAVRIVTLQQTLSGQVAALQTALAKVRQLQGLLPICSYCKRIRSDEDYWEQIDTYIAQHSEAQFSHGICPECMAHAMKELDRDVMPKRRRKP